MRFTLSLLALIAAFTFAPTAAVAQEGDLECPPAECPPDQPAEHADPEPEPVLFSPQAEDEGKPRLVASVRRYRSKSVVARVKNSGTATAYGVRLCVKPKPRRGKSARRPRCWKVGTLAAGESARRTLRTSRAVQVNATATADEAASQSSDA